MKHLLKLGGMAMVCLFTLAAGARESVLPKTTTTPQKPLSFIENKGQLTDQNDKPRADIDMKLEAAGMSVFVGDGAIHYQWSREHVKGIRQNVKKAGLPFQDRTSNIQQPTSVETYRMDVVLVGANKDAVLVKEEMQPYYENYYQPQLGEEGTTVHSYNRITYQNVYPHIDWVVYSRNNQLKYDFVVHPGGRASDIQLRYEGATKLELKDDALTATTPMGSITEAAPYSYDALTKQEIKSSYRLVNNTLRFDVDHVPAENGLVIDPVLIWATYYGGSGNDGARAVTSDALGNPYICGGTNSAANIATSGAQQQTLQGTNDGYLVKFDEAGNRLWATYYGGAGQSDAFGDLVADAFNNVYAAGSTNSTSGIATPGAHQTTATFSGTYSVGMLVKFNDQGQRQWATYYGDNGECQPRGIACDVNNNVIIAGTTPTVATTTNIASTGAWQTTPGSTFIAKFNASGTRLWGTYYGALLDYLEDVSCDGFGNIYVAGSAGSSTGISTPGTHQPILSGGNDGMLVKFNPAGSRVWGTYYGGPAAGGFNDGITAVRADANGDVYIGGFTRNTTDIATTGSYQPTLSGVSDGFVAKLTTNGTRVWGSYFGGPGVEDIWGLHTGYDGYLYVGGYTRSFSGIATPGAHQTVSAGDDAFFAIMRTDGSQTLYATYYGGPGAEDVLGFHYSIKGKYYIAGSTPAATGISTPGSFQPNKSGVADAFLAQFDADTAVYLQPGIVLISQLCVGDSLKVPYGVTKPFRPSNVFTLQRSNSAGSFASSVNLATKVTQFGDTFKIVVPAIPPGSGYRLRVVASGPQDTTEDNGININISTYPTKPVATAGTVACTGQLLNLYSSPTPAPGVTTSWTGPNSFTSPLQNPTIASPTLAATGDYIVSADNSGCASKDTLTITIGQTPNKPTATNNSPICTGGILNLFANSSTPGAGYSWSGPLGFSANTQNPVIDPAPANAGGKYAVHATLGGCNSEDDTTVVVINTVTYLGAYASPNDTVCAGTQITVVTVPVNGGTSPLFQWFKNNTLIPGATNLTYQISGAVTGDSFYCRMIATSVCSTPVTLFSNKIGITIYPKTPAATVSIGSNPAKPLPGNAVTFTATPTNGGSTPAYQWLRNGADVAGATLNTWSTNNLAPYDKISVKLTSSERCPDTNIAISNVIEVNFATGVNDVNANAAIGLYPNPNDGNFTLKGKTQTNDILTIEIVNAIGQTVHSETLQPQNHSISQTLSLHKKLAAGVYLLKVDGAVLRFVVE